jgi:predicted nucleotide-binding protein (sugar kinase/HSP70/actin superfamily)
MSETKKIEHYVIEGDCFYHIEKILSEHDDNDFFRVWCGGCGIGSAPTINEAREIIYKHSKDSLQRKIDEHEMTLLTFKKSLKILGDDKFNLGIFKNPDYHGVECNFFNGKKG